MILKTSLLTEQIQPQRVWGSTAYSAEFESCWQRIEAEATHAYLEGTEETIADLLSGRWEIDTCCRCGLPVPMCIRGPVSSGPCPCADLDHWPNDSTLPPRIQSPASFTPHQRLDQIRDRLSS